MISILEMGLEMTARGFSFKPIDLYRSDATRFMIDGDSLHSAVRRDRRHRRERGAKHRRRAGGRRIPVRSRTSSTAPRRRKTIVEVLAAHGLFPRAAGDRTSCRCSEAGDGFRQEQLLVASCFKVMLYYFGNHVDIAVCRRVGKPTLYVLSADIASYNDWRNPLSIGGKS